MGDWIPPKELNQPLPRATKMSSTLKWLMITFAGIFLIPAIMLVSISYSEARNEQILKERGVAAEAAVVNIRLGRGKSANNYYVSYQFSYSDSSGQKILARKNEETVSVRDYNNSQNANASLPVIYDPLNPSLVKINFGDWIHTADPFSLMRTMVSSVLPVFGLLFGTTYLYFFSLYVRERNLVRWGHAAEATIIEEHEFNAGRSGMATAATYEFTDSSNKIVRGVRKDLPSIKNLKYKSFQTFLGKIVDNPTALYTPQNSSKNLLYPPVYVVCCSPPQDASNPFIRD